MYLIRLLWAGLRTACDRDNERDDARGTDPKGEGVTSRVQHLADNLTPGSVPHRPAGSSL